jgi:hypothetical protein
MSSNDLDNNNQPSPSPRTSRHLSPTSSDQNYAINSDDSQSTSYSECCNQLHFFEKYHRKTGRWPPGYFEKSPPTYLFPAVVDDIEEVVGSANVQELVSHESLPSQTPVNFLYEKEISYNDAGTPAVKSGPMAVVNNKHQNVSILLSYNKLVPYNNAHRISAT